MSKVVLVTGASSGIGKAIAEHLAGKGFRVFGTSRHPEGLSSLFPLLKLDVRSPESAAACVQEVLQRAGRLDVLINNAGIIGPGAAIEETSLESARALFDSNFWGAVTLTKTVLPIMRGQGGGHILMISSTAGLVAAPPYFSFYVASKHALEGFTEALRLEAAPFHIRVALIEPGYYQSNIESTLAAPDTPLAAYAARREHVVEMDRLSVQTGGDPAEIARIAERIIGQSHPALRYPAGTQALTMSTLERILPYRVQETILNWLFQQGITPGEPGKLDPVRRMLMDTQQSDRVQKRVTVVMAVGAVIALVLRLKRRH